LQTAQRTPQLVSIAESRRRVFTHRTSDQLIEKFSHLRVKLVDLRHSFFDVRHRQFLLRRPHVRQSPREHLKHHNANRVHV
jgi:hypothetical protein